MLEELEKEFYNKLQEAIMVRESAATKESRILARQKELELMALEEELECHYSVEDMEG